MLSFKKHILFLFLLLYFLLELNAQSLKPSIGISSLPTNNTPICTIPVYTGSYYTSGITVNDTIADFTLYTKDDIQVNIFQELQDGKPILLVAGSYTCPVFRNKMPDLNTIYTLYQNNLKVFIINVVEAHPIIDASPYSGTVWVTNQNQQEGVLYRQPQTYGERKAMVDTMLNNMNVLPPVLLDGPCNEWWSYFGPAPNNAYLIKPNGTVYSKHGWFHKPPDDMFCDINNLLGDTCTGGGNTNGTFVFELTNDSIVTGSAGDVLYVYGQLINNTTGGVEIQLMRSQNNIPQNWQTAMCIDICLPTWANQTEFYLPAGQSQQYVMYFYTDSIPSWGQTQIRFRNKNMQANQFTQNFYATSINSKIENQTLLQTHIYPNPTLGNLYVENIEKGNFIITNVNGIILKSGIIQGTQKSIISIAELPTGIYFIKIISDSGVLTKQIIKSVE